MTDRQTDRNTQTYCEGAATRVYKYIHKHTHTQSISIYFEDNTHATNTHNFKEAGDSRAEANRLHTQIYLTILIKTAESMKINTY